MNFVSEIGITIGIAAVGLNDLTDGLKQVFLLD